MILLERKISSSLVHLIGIVLCLGWQFSYASESCFAPTELRIGEEIIGGTAAVQTTEVPGCSLVEDLPGSWYEIVGNGNIYTVSTCDPNTQVFTILNVFVGNNCTEGLSCASNVVEGSTQGCDTTNLSSKVSWKTIEGEVYRILVSTEELDATFGLTLSETDPPVNDL